MGHSQLRMQGLACTASDSASRQAAHPDAAPVSGEMLLLSEARRSMGALVWPIRRSKSWLTAFRSAAGDWRASMLTSPTMCTRYLYA